jgi:hypothetical protein
MTAAQHSLHPGNGVHIDIQFAVRHNVAVAFILR